MGFETLWLDDEIKNNYILRESDLIITVNIASKNLFGNINAFYCLHNSEELYSRIYNNFGENKILKLQVFTKGCNINSFKLNSCTYFNETSKTLFQPWGTDINSKNFLEYSNFKFSKISFWIGSVWNNDLNQGNLNEIKQLERVLKLNGIYLIKIRPKNEYFHKQCINKGIISPAIAGKWQVENGYLPCRMFKNISYGSLGITNVIEFEEILEENMVSKSIKIEEIIDDALKLDRIKAKKILLNQQKLIANHTYENKLSNIIKLLNTN
jgi:hypothetical protein